MGCALHSESFIRNLIRNCQLYTPGIVSYETAWEWQRSLVASRRQQDLEDVLILLEHPPVYTLGQGSSSEFLKFDPAQSTHTLCRTERGGEVTSIAQGKWSAIPS
jgi:lipoyl(octanoyl) transferase